MRVLIKNATAFTYDFFSSAIAELCFNAARGFFFYGFGLDFDYGFGFSNLFSTDLSPFFYFLSSFAVFLLPFP